MPVQVVTPGGSSNTITLEVTLRQPDGRIQWRFQTDDYTPLQFVVGIHGFLILLGNWS